MKRVLMSLVGAIALLVMPVLAQEQGDRVKSLSAERLDQIEKSLVNALESNIPGMQASAAQTVRDLKALLPDREFSRLVIPLMRIVKNEDGHACSRIVAALALSELHSDMGDFAIAREAKFSDCKRMQHICSWLAFNRVQEQNLEKAQKENLTYASNK
jgi:hypothetical protein